ncbi:MAG: CehA/McbA family metallohydrolase [Christensenellales bacterium]|jgi:hypothetical protein
MVIKIKIEKSQEKQFIKIPFDVPENVEGIRIKYSYYGDSVNSLPKDFEKNVIDIALLRPDGTEAGATGSNKKDIYLSESYSTPGYAKQEITAGKWTIICGAYLIRSEGVEVAYTIEFTYKHYRWLKGDLHTHSVYSDGKFTVPELGEKAIKNGFDYFALTDHNNFFHNKHLPDIRDLTIIPGVEFTHYKGHMNILGLETPYTGSYAVNTKDEFLALYKEAYDRGALICLNHPLCSLCPWKWDFDFKYHAVEVWNGPMRKDNLRAVSWWHNLLKDGHRVTAVGGSDFHFEFPPLINLFARPTTYVYAKSNSPEDILAAIKEGRAVIVKNPKSPFIEMTSGNAVIGDSVKLKKDTTVKITVNKLKRGYKLLVYDDDGVIDEVKGKSGRVELDVSVRKKGFVRAEIKYHPKLIERLIYRLVMLFMLRSQAFDKVPDFISALTNPIYFE